MIEEDSQNSYFDKLLERVVEDVEIKKDAISLLFSNGILVTIAWNFNSYYIYISDDSFYENGDYFNKPLGFDRINWYLKQIANYKYV